jgi:hypothetical protein
MPAVWVQPESDVFVSEEEGHLWRKGKMHRAVRLRLNPLVAGPFVVTLAVTKCGQQISYPHIETDLPAAVELCNGACSK